MESVITSRIVSSRAGSRPMSSARPVTTARPITSTGLMVPRTARGRSAAAIRRQVQDKTYWMGVLRAKMNELTMEIARLSKECDQMSKEESRIIMWQRKAETLAKELKSATLELSVYNEYWDRLRIGETRSEVLEDIEALKSENSELSENLESKYKEKKVKEDELVSSEKEIHQIEAQWSSLTRQFTDQQRERFEELDSTNKSLTMESDKLEEKIMKLTEKKSSLENRGDKASSMIRKELLSSLNRLRELERQKNDLTTDQSMGDERSRLLAQVRRDNKEITILETRLEEVTRSIEETRSSLQVYEDSETAEKFRDLKKKEATIDSFLDEFSSNVSTEIEKMATLGETISDLIDRSSRYIQFIDTLKGGSEGGPGSGDSKVTLIDEKRKLQLDLNKIEQLETKINSELESLRSKISSLSKDVTLYSNLDGLRVEVSLKEKSLEDERRSLEENIVRLGQEKKELERLVEKVQLNLKENDIYKKMKDSEKRLADLAGTNEDYQDKLRSNDHSSLKKQVLDLVNRYNQRLLGF